MSIMREHWLFTAAREGDLGSGVEPAELRRRCRSLVDAPWTLLEQVHGGDVVRVTRPGDAWGSKADAAVTDRIGAVLGVRTADCAGVVLIGRAQRSGPVAVGVAHAGWRGLLAGVLQNTVVRLHELGADTVEWRLGPCISPEHYQFGTADLEPLVERYGGSLRSATSDGHPALDLRAGVAAAMAEVEAVDVGGEPPCTAASGMYFSWRARRDQGRQVTAVWLEHPPEQGFNRSVLRADDFAN